MRKDLSYKNFFLSISGKSLHFWRECFGQSHASNNVICIWARCLLSIDNWNIWFWRIEFCYFTPSFLERREFFSREITAMSVNGILNAFCIASGILFASKLCSSVAGVVSDEDCLSRGRNCTWCLSDGNCGFCDRCGDHCHKPGAIHSLENCTNCASCIPGNLAGSKNKGHECRAEWWVFYSITNGRVSLRLASRSR